MLEGLRRVRLRERVGFFSLGVGNCFLLLPGAEMVGFLGLVLPFVSLPLSYGTGKARHGAVLLDLVRSSVVRYST